jgi:Kdo2-lipid IVA lauroyltransferase/acyltransferase
MRQSPCNVYCFLDLLIVLTWRFRTRSVRVPAPRNRTLTVFADIILFFILKSFQQFLRIMPERAACGLGAALGGAACLVLKKRRLIARANARRIHAGLTEVEARRIVRKCFQKLGINFVETLLIPYMKKEHYEMRFTLQNREHAEKALKDGKGLLALSFHYGNWEIMGVISNLLGCEIVALARPLKNQRLLNGFLTSLRVSTGLSVIANQDTARDAMKHLKENRMVAILGDQRDKRSKGILVDFFGEKVPTSRGIALLAMKTGVPMIPIYAERNGFLRYTFVFSEPLEIERRHAEGESMEDVVYRNTRKINAFLETIVANHPDEWLLVHRRFGRHT